MSESGEDDDHQLETVHLLATNKVSKVTETKLADDGTTRGSDLDGGISSGRDFAGIGLSILPVDDAENRGSEGNSEDVVSVSKETYARNDDGTDVVPAKGCLVNLSESQTSSLVGVLNMGIVIVEVVESGVSAGGLGRHCKLICL